MYAGVDKKTEFMTEDKCLEKIGRFTEKKRKREKANNTMQDDF